MTRVGPRTTWLLAATVVALAVVGATAALPGGQAVVVADAATGEPLFVAHASDGTAVTLAYTHSVERSPVVEEYVVEGPSLVMTRMTFESYGWGLPAGADVELVDGAFVTHPDWTATELLVAPGAIAGHHLVVDGREVDLVERSGGRTVRISVARRSLLGAAIDTRRAS